MDCGIKEFFRDIFPFFISSNTVISEDNKLYLFSGFHLSRFPNFTSLTWMLLTFYEGPETRNFLLKYLWFSEKVLRVKLEEIYVVSKAEYAYEISSNRCLRELSRSWERAGCTYSQSSTCLSPTLFLLNFTRLDLTLTFIENLHARFIDVRLIKMYLTLELLLIRIFYYIYIYNMYINHDKFWNDVFFHELKWNKNRGYVKR